MNRKEGRKRERDRERERKYPGHEGQLMLYGHLVSRGQMFIFYQGPNNKQGVISKNYSCYMLKRVWLFSESFGSSGIILL